MLEDVKSPFTMLLNTHLHSQLHHLHCLFIRGISRLGSATIQGLQGREDGARWGSNEKLRTMMEATREANLKKAQAEKELREAKYDHDEEVPVSDDDMMFP